MAETEDYKELTKEERRLRDNMSIINDLFNAFAKISNMPKGRSHPKEFTLRDQKLYRFCLSMNMEAPQVLDRLRKAHLQGAHHNKVSK